MNEEAVVFHCGNDNDQLVGIVHQPANPITTGLVIIVAGGPQFRVGAHRQFVVLGRRMAALGMPVLRFDHRGTGDSGGEYRGFLDMKEDISAAIDTLFEKFPHLEKVVLWGECESASAGGFYAYTDPRVSGVFMVNPWIRTEAGQAKTYLKHYYWNRLRDPALWKKIRSGQFSIFRSIKAYLTLLIHARKDTKGIPQKADEQDLTSLPLPIRLTQSLKRFKGELYILTSGNDYIAQEFNDFIASSPEWKASDLNKKILFNEMKDADHTFSRPEWREALFKNTEQWIQNKHCN
jgi:exosortase A-associated hydrolase 1